MTQLSKYLSDISYYLSKGYTYSQIAQELRISRERVRQICLEHFGQSMSKHKHLSPEETQAKLNNILNLLEQGQSVEDIAKSYHVSAQGIHTFLSIHNENYVTVRSIRAVLSNRKNRTKITPEIISRLYELREAGAPYKAIQGELGICERTINRYLQRSPELKHTTRTNARIPQEQREQVIKLFKQGAKKSDISFDLRISIATIIRILRQAGLMPLQHDISVIQRCQELRKQGYTTRAISQELKISPNDICFYLKLSLG